MRIFELPHIFTYDQGNFLIRMVLSHIVVDFVVQTRRMVDNKSWFSRHMLFHILLVAGCGDSSPV